MAVERDITKGLEIEKMFGEKIVKEHPDMYTILIIDDDKAVSKMLGAMIRRMNCEPVCCATIAEGLAVLRDRYCDAVLLDVQLPDGYGLDIIPAIRASASEPEVVILTGFGTADGAEIAIKNGAWDYIRKSDSPQEVTLSLKRVIDYRREKDQTRTEPVALKLDHIVGKSKAIKACYDQVARAAAGNASVLISGETGTGKEIFARAIHANSSRSEANIVVVDCAALPATLVESLLFGHEKGAYTGAESTREGLVAQADGGTLFLDEVGEMQPEIQRVFLRVLQERRYRPVGGRHERASDFRLIAATNQNLNHLADSGGFRKDLLYRIRAIEIHLPPLRERPEDISPLVFHYLTKICDRSRIGFKGVSADFLAVLNDYPWPGNVRELINALETALSNAGPDLTLISRYLPQNIRLHAVRKEFDPASAVRDGQPGAASTGPDLSRFPLTYKIFKKNALAAAEKQYLEELLSASGNRTETALRLSGLSRSRFYELIKQHNLSL
ncbi:MAG: sigma-54-dependent transcriptional regulator [Thermodesulfobacteriota bacterium]